MTPTKPDDVVRSVARTEGVQPREAEQYHVFIASPGDVNEERQAVRDFFKAYNRNYAEPRGLHFEVIDWENYSSAGVGRPQELITEQTLERYHKSLALVVGMMAQRFGSNSGTHESGTEEEFEWAVASYAKHGFPEVKWFFRDAPPSFDSKDPEVVLAGVAQWQKVLAFHKRLDTEKTVFPRSYKDLVGFKTLLDNDIGRWLNSPDRRWFRPGPPPAARASAGWPQHVVESLANQLGDEFDFHMRAGEELSPDQARSRYVQGILKLRRESDERTTPVKDQGSLKGGEGTLDDLLTLDGLQLLVIGAGGSGKSTMLKHLAADGARRAVQNDSAPIFLYLRLAGFDRDDRGYDLLLDRLSISAHLDRKDFETLWREGPRPIVLLLDGLNEVPQSCQSSCSRALQMFLQSSPVLHKAIITSRPGGEFEVMSSRSTENRRLRVADVLEFKPEQIQKYLEAQGRREVYARISGPLAALASNPFLLWAITRTLASSQGAGFSNRGSLFRALIDRYIFEEREQSKPRPRATDYNYQYVKKPVLAQLALVMTETGVTEVSDDLRLWQQVLKHLAALEKEHRHALPLEAEIFMPKDFAAATLLREAVDNGVLLKDGNRIRFMHESVQEYFAAAALNSSTIEDLVRRAPVIKLSQLDARGSMFETLVTWAGLATTEMVTALSERIEVKHPLLAACLCVESGAEGELERLRHQLLSQTRSEHEQRRLLGAMGLAVTPSHDPELVARLIEMLDESSLESPAKDALKILSTKRVISALVEAAIGTDELENKHAILLKEIAPENCAVLAEVLCNIWNVPAFRQDRIAGLAAFLDAARFESVGRPVIRETLMTLAVAADMVGDVRRSKDLDALLWRAERVVLPPLGLDGALARLHETVARYKAAQQAREPLEANCAKKDDAELERLVRDRNHGWGVALDELVKRGSLTAVADAELERLVRDRNYGWRVALNGLVKRGSPAAVAPLVETILSNPQDQNLLNCLGSFPRDQVLRYLTARSETLDGKLLSRARLLSALLTDPPQRSALQTVFREHGKALRAFAAQAAVRAGAEGITLLIEELANDADSDVLEACVGALAETGERVAIDHLIDLLLEPASRGHWPTLGSNEEEERISDPEAGASSSVDSSAAFIHKVLAASGAAERILQRIEQSLHSRQPGDAVPVIHEARRCLPDARAVECLRRAMLSKAPTERLWAGWSLACAGDADAWRALLHAELETPPDFVGFSQDVARRLDAMATDDTTRNLLIAAAQSVLRPALTASDRNRRAVALQLTRRLSEKWIDDAWRHEILATAEQLLPSREVEQRIAAARAIHRFDENGDNRIFQILMKDADQSVIATTPDLLGEAGLTRLNEALQSALRLGEAANVLRLVAVVGKVVRYKADKCKAIRELVERWLDDGNCDQCASAILALATLYDDGDKEEERVRLGKHVRAAFQHHGIDETWRRIAPYAGPLDESERKFFYLVFDAFDDDLDLLASFVAQAAVLWPDDLVTIGSSVHADIRRGKRDGASERLERLQTRFADRAIQVWLAARFAELGQNRDALEYYRMAAARDPANADGHFAVGWYAFLTADFEASIASTRRSLELQPTTPMAHFNLGVALLALGDVVSAEVSYRRGIAFARWQAPDIARQALDGALGDFQLLPKQLPDTINDAVERIRLSLTAARDPLGERASPDALAPVQG